MSARQENNNLLSTLKSLEYGKKFSIGLFLVLTILCFAGVIYSVTAGYIILSIILVIAIIFSLVIIIIIGFSVIRSGKVYSDELNNNLEAKKQFISDFSHLIRTSLNNFSLIIGLFDNTGLDSKQKELIDTLVASTNNMVNEVNVLFVKTAEEMPSEVRKKIKFNLISSLHNTIELYHLRSGSVSAINIQTDEKLKDEYFSDPVALKQIFLGLFNMIELKGSTDLKVGIEIEAIKSGRVSDEVSFTFKTNKKGQFTYSVQDGSEKSKSLYSRLILELGGSYSSSSGADGSVFTFNLPLTIVKDEPKPTEVAQRIKKLSKISDVSKSISESNILLVEDNLINQKIVLISLQKKVRNVDTATNGKEALDLFGKSNYDLILMDIQLPVMDGLITVNKIRELESSTNKHTPIIAITANAMIGDKEKCLSAGMDEYLSKPFQPRQLIELIEKLLAGK